jgi:prepilin-type N-terminal cleavage/methylation domain-containing protein
MKALRNSRGVSLIEIIIAMFITGLISAAGFHFYIQMHNSALTQEEISDMQQSSRASLEEICKNLRMAGFKLDSTHAAYRINGESLYVFASITQPVDTILYFLQSYNNYELVMDDSLARDLRPRKLMIKVNSGQPEVFADNIRAMKFNPVSSRAVEISLTVQPLKSDMTYLDNGGYRMHTATERVKIRNADI